MADQKPITAPRAIPRHYIEATLATARNQLVWCERNNLPVGAERARKRIALCEAKLAAPKGVTP